MTYWNIDNIHDNPILSEELKKIQEKFWKKSREWTCQVYKEKYWIYYNLLYFSPILIRVFEGKLHFTFNFYQKNFVKTIKFFDYEKEKFANFLLSWNKIDLDLKK